MMTTPAPPPQSAPEPATPDPAQPPETDPPIVPPVRHLRLPQTHRLIPSRYPTVGILDLVSDPEDLELMFELEGWTNDRITGELGLIRTIPPEEWVVGRPMASVVMAAFCHPSATGGRFNDSDRGAWYAALTLDTAHAEAAFHRSRELAEIGVRDARLEMRQYVASFDTTFHDLRARNRAYEAYYDPVDYTASQRLGRTLRHDGANGIIYRSVRDPDGVCLACFRPRLVLRLRQGAHFEYRWQESAASPAIRMLQARAPSG